MSTRKPEDVQKDKETVKISMGKKQIGIIAIIILFIGSSLAFGVFAGGRSAGSGSERIHWHADWAVFIGGEQWSFDSLKYYERYHPVDLHPGYPTVIHYHPSPLQFRVFLNSLSWTMTDECVQTDLGDRYCNNSTHSLKFYVNGQPNDQYGEYVANDLDKILISYGPKGEDISQQITLVNGMTGARAASAGQIAG